MIQVLPVLLLNTLSPNTDIGMTTYNYKTSYTLAININVLNVMNGSGQSSTNYCNSGIVSINGYCYLNNAQSYRFNVNELNFSLDYYVENTSTGFSTYGGTNDTHSFYFDERDSYLNFYSSISYDNSQQTAQVNVGLRTGGLDIYTVEPINNDYYSNYIYDENVVFEFMTISNSWFVDFENDSTWIDYFENSIQSAIRASELPMSESYNNGYRDGKEDGYTDGWDNGYIYGRNEGSREGYDNGYREGYQNGVDTDATAAAIYAGIIATGMIPIQFFLTIFNFEIFGINLTGLVTSLMSVCIVLIVIKRTFAIHEDD